MSDLRERLTATIYRHMNGTETVERASPMAWRQCGLLADAILAEVFDPEPVGIADKIKQPDAMAFARAVFDLLVQDEGIDDDDLVDLLLLHGLGKVESVQGTYGIDVVLVWHGGGEGRDGGVD